jgi:N-methylhydantoinase B
VSPIVVNEKSLRPDSGGAGRRRGGLGQTFRFTVRDAIPFVVNTMCDQIHEAPYGILGGGPGAPSGYTIEGVELPQFKAMVAVPPGREVQMSLPGAGGYGDPLTRDPALVLEDVIDGRVTAGAAGAVYGVALRGTDGGVALDGAGTTRLRGQARPASAIP